MMRCTHVGRALRPTLHRPPTVSGINPDLRARRAFTLLEVVVSIGIFAIGMVAVIGLFTPVAKSVGDIADAEAATHVVELLNVQLQAQEAVDLADPAAGAFASFVARLKVSTAKSHQLTDSDANTSYDVATDAQLLFASHDGTKIGGYNDAVWKTTAGANNDRDKFFEIALIRNETFSPKATTTTDNSGTTTTINPDAAAPLLAYTARIRWPAFVALAGPTGSIEVGANPTATVKFDYSQKRVFFFAGTVAR
jgi:prepilin-type N-terminal cleavage/methylation domain-containing protein